MRYDEAANFLLDLRRYGPKPGTESTADLLASLGDPHQDGPDYVQIAGSNGKGSTARFTESILRAAGLDVGLYTSPHFDDVRERVTVNGRRMSKAALTTFIETITPYVTERAADGAAPTYFEVVTAMALWQFSRADVDVAVLEVGIGGRLDATSVVDPSASAVTSVTLEHTDVLGETIPEIARDKAHVAPAGDTPLVTATTDDALAAVRDHAGAVRTVGDTAGRDVTATYEGRTNHTEAAVSITGDDWSVAAEIPLLGDHQAENAGVAAALARQTAGVDDDAIARGLRSAHWPGRFEVMGADPVVVLDGAHNPGACGAVAETVAEFDYDRLLTVFGAMHDKDHGAMAAALPTPDHVWACEPVPDRAEDADVLAAVFEDAGAGAVSVTRAVESAVADAIAEATADDLVLVAGSLFAVAEARTRWTRTFAETDVDSLNDARDALERAHVTPPGVWRMRGKGVHRVVKTRVQTRQAQYLKEELLSLGGECSVSGLNAQSGAMVDAVMMATMAQFKRLCEKLDGQPYGLSEVGADLRESLGIQAAPATHGYPWEGERTAVMGILNVTPDSFHDGGEYDALEDAVARAESMAENGVDVIDIGGESTRPGADAVSVADELDRVLPVIERISDLDVLLSVDTRKAEVARQALEAGADILNDVTGLDDPEMRFVAAEYDAPIVVMHSIDAPVDPDSDPDYDDVVDDVIAELTERVLLAEKAGVPRERIIVDPGLGFGKSAAEGFELLNRADEFHALGGPVLVGHSHKSMFGAVDRYPDEGGYATAAASALAADRGADIVRVHDVPENVAAVRVAEATRTGADAE
ncbi:dihydropteroate synthase [Halobacterium salinarum]|uniref:dihydropteroate synthase n=1 Tax=Halobacterium salinarum TaxID=2242 RepID=UPI001F461062|nr:dihydropteroate synthase [Halobacterium salinarum]MCF2207647.1 dihydropteroate synthase [Halobacterium salinarum]